VIYQNAIPAIGGHGSAYWSDSRTKPSAESTRSTHQFHKSPRAAPSSIASAPVRDG